MIRNPCCTLVSIEIDVFGINYRKNRSSVQIEQLLINLFVITLWALVDGGTIFLETSFVSMIADDCQPYKMNTGLGANFNHGHRVCKQK